MKNQFLIAIRSIDAILPYIFIFLLSINDVYAVSISSEDNPLWQDHYYGTLGKSTQINAYLYCQPDGQITGSYRYLKNGAPIRLIGKIEPNGEFKLIENTQKAKNEQTTGKLTGQLNNALGTISGTWSSPDGSKSYPINLKKGILVDVKQIDELPNNKGVLVNMAAVPLAEAKSFCYAIGSTADDRRTMKTCKTEKFTQIAEYKGVGYFQGTFQEKGNWLDSSNYRQKHAILFEVSNGNAKPFWFFTERGDGSSLEDIRLLKDKSGPIFHVTYNSGGTLPSWSDFIIRKPDGFTTFDTEGIELEVFEIAEKRGYETRNTLYYEFTKRRASNVLYKSSDPNCCGSAEISLRFDISGNRLILKDYKIEIENK